MLAKTTTDYVSIGTSSNEFIRNSEAWATARTNKTGILSKISDSALDEFELSMSFSKKTGVLLRADCTKISNELGSRVHEFFELFGIDSAILGSFYPYKCNKATGLCEKHAGFYCFKNKNENCTD
jgi:hypothetical protein